MPRDETEEFPQGDDSGLPEPWKVPRFTRQDVSPGDCARLSAGTIPSLSS
jgi:hypothetical protein